MACLAVSVTAPATLLQALLGKMQERTFSPEEDVFQEGAQADYFYVIAQGSAKVRRRGAHLLSCRPTTPGRRYR